MKNHDRYGQHIYGTVHQKLRKRWAPKVRQGIVHCWRCGRLITPGQKWDLGHLDNGRGRYPEHRSCNRATVTILKQKLAEAEAAAPRGSREW
jgi:hypothetical protein